MFLHVEFSPFQNRGHEPQTVKTLNNSKLGKDP